MSNYVLIIIFFYIFLPITSYYLYFFFSLVATYQLGVYVSLTFRKRNQVRNLWIFEGQKTKADL